MKIASLLFFCGLAPVLLAQTPCTAVTGDQITGADLARAVPALAAIPPRVPVAPSPQPGGSRIFYLPELQSIASRFRLALAGPAEACFQLALEPLNRDRVLDAMRKALSMPEARIELADTSSVPVPVGSIEFTRDRLSVPASPDQRTPVLWRGDVIYGGGRRFAIWGSVRITAPVARVIAAEPLRAGVPIRTGQTRLELVEAFPNSSAAPLSPEQTIGMTPVRPIAAGAEVRSDNLTRPNDVNRGDLVHVEVRVGSAHLSLTGKAESGGHVGESVAVRNPDSSRIFQALVEGSGRVVVEGPGPGRD